MGKQAPLELLRYTVLQLTREVYGAVVSIVGFLRASQAEANDFLT